MPAEISLAKAVNPVLGRAISLEDVAFNHLGKVTTEQFRACGRSCHPSKYIKNLGFSSARRQERCSVLLGEGQAVFIQACWL